MSKINSRLSKIALILLIGLSACTVKQEPKVDQPTDEEVLTALRDEFHVNDTSVKMSDFKLVSHAPEGIHDDVVTTFTLQNNNGTFDLKVSIRFLKTGSVFKPYSIDIETLASQVHQAPNPNDILQFDSNITNYTSSMISYPVIEGVWEPMVCALADLDYEDGTTRVDCVDTMSLLDLSAIGTNRFNGMYDYNKGWTYTFESWTFVETIQFDQPLIFKFPSIMNRENNYLFKADETITLRMEGKLTLTYEGSETASIDDKMTGTLDHNGVLLPVTMEIVQAEDGLKIGFVYGSRPEEVLFLSIDTGGGRCGPSSPPTYYLLDSNGNYAFWMNDTAAGNATVGTMSESECRIAN